MDFFFVTLTDLEEQKTTVQTYDVLRSYEYTYPTPQMDWQLVSGDSIINQRACKRPFVLLPVEIILHGTLKR